MRSPPPANPRQVALRFKDSLREIHFTARHSVRQAMRDLLTTSAVGKRTGLPLDQAAEKAWHALEGLEDAAAQWLSPSAEYRRMDYALMPAGGEQGLTQAGARQFQTYFYWTLKHLLNLQQQSLTAVSEEALYRAWQALHSQPAANAAAPQALACAQLLLALKGSAPFHLPPLAPPTDKTTTAATSDVHDTVLHTLVAAVLAGEIAAARADTSPARDVEGILRMAHTLACGHAPLWQVALSHPDPQQALAREMDFVLRHV